MFAATPKQYRDSGLSPGPRSQQELDGKFINHLRYAGIDMKPRLEEKNEFYVLGVGDVVDRDANKIGASIWPEFQRRFGEIKNKKGNDHGYFITYGIYKKFGWTVFSRLFSLFCSSRS